MPINPNIALGVQQQQPVNMLGQLGQIYALKGAKQEFEGNEALREAYAQGGDLNDPAFRQRVMAANPKLGSQLIKTSAETSKLQNEAVAKRIELSREMLTGINTPEDYLAWHESNHKDPVLGSYLSQRGVTAEDSRAKIMAELGKPGGLERLKRESALGAGKLQQELMQTERSVQVANIGAGPGYQRNALEREKYDDQLRYGGAVVTTTIPDPENPKERIEIQTRRNIRGGELIPLEVQAPPMRVDISPSSATSSYQPSGGSGVPNVLATQVAPQGSPTSAPIVNGLNPNAPQPQAPTGATFAMPKSTSQNLTEYQGKSTAFAIRAKQAHEILNVVGKGGEVQPGLIKRAAEAIPFVGEGLGTALNVTQSDAQQQVEQAQRNFVNAVLRQESGAAINESEFNNAKKQYFPQPGDSAAVIEQKRLNREAAIQGFEVSAGPGAKKTTPPSAGPARIGSDSEYNALPSGATFTAPDGTIRRKP
jgi:hypothetical protein